MGLIKNKIDNTLSSMPIPICWDLSFFPLSLPYLIYQIKYFVGICTR